MKRIGDHEIEAEIVGDNVNDNLLYAGNSIIVKKPLALMG